MRSWTELQDQLCDDRLGRVAPPPSLALGLPRDGVTLREFDGLGDELIAFFEPHPWMTAS